MCLTVFGSLISIGSWIYMSIGSLIRYWYVKSSLQVNVQNIYHGQKMFYVVLLLPQVNINARQILIEQPQF